MSRARPSDTFTRFTANSPHASQKPAAATSPQASSSPAPSRFSAGPDGETPAQKVARLRMQARAQKMNAQLSTADRVLVTGRRWADNAHRATTYALLGLAGMSALVAAYSLFSLVGHNRRQKRAWLDRELDRLEQAQQAFLRGEADAEQLHLLEQERAGEEMKEQKQKAKEKAKSEGMWSQMKGLLGRGAAAGELGEETAEEARVREMRSRGGKNVLEDGLREVAQPVLELKRVAVQESGIKGVGLDAKGRPVPINKVEKVMKMPDEPMTAEDGVAMRITRTGPGSLDAMASNMAESVNPSTSNVSWMSWLRGSS